MNVLRHIPKEERFNVISHGIGLLLFVFGMLPVFVIKYHGPTLGLVAFILGVLAVYTSSTLYHAAVTPVRKHKFRIADHIAIYYLIGGTYTAYMLKYLDPNIAYPFLAIHWFIIVGGTLLKIFYTGKLDTLSTVLYLVLGWMLVGIWSSFKAALPSAPFTFIVLGGVSYTIGVFFYLRDRPVVDHGIWHIFVFGGTVCHLVGLLY